LVRVHTPWLLCKPSLPDERYLHGTISAWADDRACPQISHRCRSILVFRIQIADLGLRLFQHPRAPLLHISYQCCARSITIWAGAVGILRWLDKGGELDDMCHRIQAQGVGLAAQTERL